LTDLLLRKLQIAQSNDQDLKDASQVAFAGNHRARAAVREMDGTPENRYQQALVQRGV